jgi:DNA-binding PadR family transcriptional regulator
MTAVFSHGRLRLYLLKLLAEGPKHGYELIRLLENRFHGLYAPSAGTIYPRLARLEAEGLISHAAAGGRKVYEITAAGREELSQRTGELADLEREIHASVADLTSLASEIEQQVHGSARDIKRELREAARESRTTGPRGRSWSSGPPSSGPPQAAAAELERAVGQLATEVGRLVRRAGVTAHELRAAAAMVNGAIEEIRHLHRD